MAKNLTSEQRTAIFSKDCNLLVSAGAGSGKTFVLVQRIIHLITDAENPVNIDRLLVVTFTEAAAQEMKQRIALAINEMLEENPLDEHLRKQAVLINKAPISTIHSYCNSIIRQYFHVVGVDPSYRIGDQTETALLQEEAMEEVFEDAYLQEDNPLFYALIEIFSDRLTDEKLKDLVLRIYQFSSNSPEPDKWLSDYSRLFQMETGDGPVTLDETLWAVLIKNSVNLQLSSAIASAEEAISICRLENGPEKYIDNLNDDISELLRLKSSCDKSFQEMYTTFRNISFSRLATIKAGDTTVDEGLKSMVKEIRDKEIKYTVNAIKNRIFFKPPQELVGDLKNLWPYMDKLAALVSQFRKTYRQKKGEKNLLDFNDLEHFALEILVKRPDIAEALKEKYAEIFIDEYQDSNMVQETILSAVAKENNRFMVGDVKQSIYKFRRAKPEIFLEKYLNYTYDGPNKKIDLSENFRSRKEVLDSVNFIFSQLMSRTIGEIDYGENEALNCGAQFPETEKDFYGDTEILLIDTSRQDMDDLELLLEDYSNAELEGTAIGRRVKEFVGGQSPQMVFDGADNDYRPAEYKDIVILLRSMTNAETIAEELQRMGIPAYTEASTGFFQNIEVLTLLSLLKIIDNPKQDIHLIGVLHSPIYNLSADDLYIIRSGQPKGDFYNALVSYRTFCQDTQDCLNDTLTKFMEDLGRWRHLSVYVPVAKLVMTVLDETNYMNYVGIMPGGAYRQNNLRIFAEYAVQYEKTNYRGLFNFVRYLEKLMQKDTKIGDAKASGQTQNAVRLMTIHKSKGLEFPIVFVSSLGSKFNKVDERQDIILHQDYGFGPKYTDLANRIKYDTLARIALAEKTQLENFSEELRVLYVALTRAKEKLILTGCSAGIEKRMEKWARAVTGKEKKLSPGYLMKATTPLDWLMPAVLRSKSAEELLLKHNIHFSYGNNDLYAAEINFHMQIFTPAMLSMDIVGAEQEPQKKEPEKKGIGIYAQEAEALYQSIDGKLSWQYPHEALTKLPTKILISEIKRNYFSQQKYDAGDGDTPYMKPLYSEPKFMVKERKLTSAEKGTALHTVMEHLDIRRHQDIESIKQLVEALYTKRLLSEQEKAAVPIQKIFHFTQSALGQRMKRSAFIKKEAPFVMTLSPEEVYVEKGKNPANAEIMVHGIVDCYFEEQEEIVLVDYKTDYATEAMLNDIIAKYRIQLSIYKKAIEKAHHKRVKECIVYLFHLDKAVKIDLD